MLKNFEEIVERVRANPVKRTMAVAAAADGAVIDAVLHARREGLVEAIYVGDAAQIRQLLAERGVDPDTSRIVDARTGAEAGQKAAELVRDGEADILMKGMLETKEFLGPIVKKENGLRTGSIMSHVVFFQIPNYHKLLMTTDGGMIMYPTLEDKKHIIENATSFLRDLGYDNPKHAVVCAVEKLNPKMVETVEAAELQKMNEEGILRDCVVVGPISYDVAMDKHIAEHKGYKCEYVGDFDCMIMPNMQAGNILGKCFTVTLGAPMAGVIVGAKVPAIMKSRGSDAAEKFYSIAMAALAAGGADHV